MNPRKFRRFYAFLFVCFFWQGPAALAQEFIPPTPVETLVQEVADGIASTIQFEALRDFAQQEQLAADISHFLDDPDNEIALDKTFVVDGHYGEKTDGTILVDWDDLAKTMGTTGAILAGAYTIWRRRKQSELSRLRAGDASLVEDLFAGESSPHKDFSDQDWKNWATKKGLPGAGALFMSLFGVWQRRRERATTNWGQDQELLERIYAPEMDMDEFRSAVLTEVDRLQKKAEVAAFQDFLSKNPEPVLPEIPTELQALKDVNKHLTDGVIDFEALGISRWDARKYGNGITNIFSLMRYNYDRIPANKVAPLVAESLETLQRAMTIMMHRNEPDFAGLSVNANGSLLNHYYSTIQKELKNWWSSNQYGVTDRDQYSRLSRLMGQSIWSNTAPYREEAKSYQSILEQQRNFTSDQAAWQNAWNEVKANLSPLVGPQISHKALSYWQDRYQANRDDETWARNLKSMAIATQQGKANLSVQEKQDFARQLTQLLGLFSADELTALLKQGLSSEKEILTGPTPIEKKQKIEIQIERLNQQREDVWNLSAFLKPYGVYKDPHGTWRDPKTGVRKNYNTFTEELTLYHRQFDQQIQQLQDEQVAFTQAYEKQQMIAFWNEESTDLPLNFPDLASLQQTLTWFLQNADEAYQAEYQAKFARVRSNLAALGIARNRLKYETLSWSKTEYIKDEIKQLEQENKSLTDQIFQAREMSLLTSLDYPELRTLSLSMAHEEAQDELRLNPIEVWNKSQAADRLFYQKYGLMNRAEYLAEKVAALEEKIDFMVEHETDYTKDYNGFSWYSLGSLKSDLKTLKSGELPMVNWSPNYWGGDYVGGLAVPPVRDNELRMLYYRYANSPDSASRQKWKAEIEIKETELFLARAAEWQTNQAETIDTKFTTEEIAAYEALKTKCENCARDLGIIEDLVAKERVSFVDQIQTQNQTKATTNKTGPTLPFGPKELKTLPIKVEGVFLRDPQLPLLFEKPFWEAFRRFQTDYDEFVSEVRRLMIQAQKNMRRDRIAKAGVPEEPVMTKAVRDYLENPGQTVADVDREIAEIQAALPTLEKKYAGQAYLQTARDQARAKIDALERYKKRGPVAAAAYQARLADYEQKYRPGLAQIDAQLELDYAHWEHYTKHYFAQAAALLEKKKTDNQYVPTDPELIEYAETLEEAQQREVAEQAALSEHWAILEPAIVSSNTAFASAQAATKQAKSGFGTIVTWDELTNKRIEVLNPLLQVKAQDFINAVEAELGLQLRITDGYRSIEAQQALVEAGEVHPVAPAGLSYHNYGQAFDVAAIDEEGQVNYDLDWEAIGKVGEKLGLTWGGRWTGDKQDKPHFELDLGQSVEMLNAKRLAGDLIDDIYFDPEIELVTSIKKGAPATGLTQRQAEKIPDYSEAHFQVWQKYHHTRVGSIDLAVSRLKFVREVLPNLPDVSAEVYDQFLMDLAGVSDFAREEIEEAHQHIIDILKKRVSGSTVSVKRYIDNVREIDINGVINPKVAAIFAADVYGKEDLHTFGFEKGDVVRDRYGLDSSDFSDPKSGFKAEIYENHNTVIVSFAGTNDLNDWLENLKQGAGLNSDQYDKARNLADRVQQNIKRKKIVFIGHSLGGGLAATAAAVTGKPAITFNAAGVSPFTLKQMGVSFDATETISSFYDFNLPGFLAEKFRKEFSNIDNYVTHGDILTEMQEGSPYLPTALGDQHLVKWNFGSFVLDKLGKLGWVFKLMEDYDGVNQHRNYK